MQLQPILVLTLTVQLCIATPSNNFKTNKRVSSNFNRLSKTTRNLNSNIDSSLQEDVYLGTPQLIAKYGYRVEIHRVVTSDGYILELHRIPRPRAIPVLLVHGFVDSSAAFVLMGPNQGLAYFLADLGYDVWMINCRGNTYSKKHVALKPSQPEFWDFTFHEMGIYDLPATIDYILRLTSFRRLHYIGHSQGGTTFFIMCSQRPEYNRKIISMQALAPAVFVNSGTSPIAEIATYFQDQIKAIIETTKTYEFLGSNDFFKRLGSRFCRDGKATQPLCSNVLFLLGGFDEYQINKTAIPVIYGHLPAGASAKQALHFAQFKRNGRFQQYDYGTKENLQNYGRKTPPEYDLRKVSAKVAIHYGANDILVVPKDIEKLRLSLPNLVGKYLVNFPKFNHFDFTFAIDARSLVYYKVVRLMQAIQNGLL